MNNSPERNTNSRPAENASGSTQYRANRTPTSSAQRPAQTQIRSTNYANSRTPQNQSAQSTQQRRPLTDEERRRLEAARLAAMKSSAARDHSPGQRANDQAYAGMAAAQQRNPNINQRQIPAQQTRTTQTVQNQQMPRKRKKKIRINAGAVAFIVLIAAVIGVSAGQIAKNRENINLPNDDQVNSDQLQNGDVSGEKEELDHILNGQETEGEEDEINLVLYDTVAVQNATIDEGDLILVNYQYEYKKTDTVELKNAYNEKTGKLKVSSTTIGMTPEAFDALEKMVLALEADTGCDDLLLNSGYRNVDSQIYLYNQSVANNGEEYAENYVAKPGYSEHHTGLSCDLTFYTDDGKIVPITDHQNGSWLGVEGINYGFVRRYPQDKVDITKIAYEAWHFRYVGIPHALAMTERDFCLEEYIDAVKSYTPDTQMLHVKESGALDEVSVESLPTEDGWLVYYVPAAEGETTDIRIPRGNAYSEYEISGNNVDGFIVTITLD